MDNWDRHIVSFSVHRGFAEPDLATSMKPSQIIFGLLIGILLGGPAGYLLAREQARAAIVAGPDSDNYPPALAAILEAKERIRSGDTNVIGYLDVAQSQIEQARLWTRRFIGQQHGSANVSQPVRSETNRTASTPGSQR